MRRNSVLFVGVVLSLTPQAMSEEGATAAQEQAAARANRRAEQLVSQQLDAIEKRLAQEEKRIESRLAQLAQQREAALKKNDSKTLDRIETLEKRAISDYDARVTQIIKTSERHAAAQSGRAQHGSSRGAPSPSVGSIPQQPEPPQTQATRRGRPNAAQRQSLSRQTPRANAQRTNAQRTNAQPASAQRAKSETKRERQPTPRRRFRLWPF